MTVRDLNHVNITAPAERLRKVRDFYVEVIGLVEGPRPDFGIGGYWLYAGDRALVHLIEPRDGAAPLPAGGSMLDHIAFSCSDLPATVTRLERSGIPFQRREFPEYGFTQLFVTDPAGLGVELNFES